MYVITIKLWKDGHEGRDSYTLEAFSLEDAIKSAKSKVSDFIGDFAIEVSIAEGSCGHFIYTHKWRQRATLETTVSKWRRAGEILEQRLHLDKEKDLDILWAMQIYSHPPDSLSTPERAMRASAILRNVVPGVEDPVIARAVLVELQRIRNARRKAERTLAHLELGEGSYIAGIC